jgi:GNAT superfamily N-acetyltransferase
MAEPIAPRNNGVMLIRPLTLKTAPSALPLLEAQYREHDIDMGGPRLRRALHTLLGGNGVAFVALDPGPVGVAALPWTFSVERGGRQAWLEELYVVPERRGEGIGRTLLRHALAAARRRGCVTVELEVVRGHERAARLYLREGFRKLPRARYSLALK